MKWGNWSFIAGKPLSRQVILYQSNQDTHTYTAQWSISSSHQTIKMCSSPYFPTTFFFCRKNYHVNQKCSGLSQESHHEKSLELSYLTSDTCPLMCDNSFQTSLSSGPAPRRTPLSHPLSLSLFFFYTKIHESLASGVTEGWIKVLLLPLHRLKSPQFSWISLTEGIIHPRSYTTEPRKVKLMGEIHNFVLEKCSLQSVQMCFIFLLCLPPHMSHSGGRGKRRNVFSVYPPFYVQLQDLLTQFNYGTFPKRH